MAAREHMLRMCKVAETCPDAELQQQLAAIKRFMDEHDLHTDLTLIGWAEIILNNRRRGHPLTDPALGQPRRRTPRRARRSGHHLRRPGAPPA